MTIADKRRDWQERALWDGENRCADGGVVVILGGGRGDYQIVRVVAARQEDANQGLVIRDVALGDRGIHEPQVANGTTHGSGADGGAGGLTNELAAVEHGSGFLFHNAISE